MHLLHGSRGMRDVVVTFQDKVFDGRFWSGDVVDIDHVCLQAANALDKHERDVVPLQLEKVGEVGIVIEQRVDNETVDVLRHQKLNEFPLEVVRALGVRHQQVVPPLFRRHLRPDNNIREVRIVDLLHDQAYTLLGCRLETAPRSRTWAIVEIRDGLKDFASRMLTDRTLSIDDGRDGAYRYAGSFCHVVYRRVFTGHAY